MDFVVDQVVQLQHVHVANGDRLRVRFAGTTVEQHSLAVVSDQLVAVAIRQGAGKQALDGFRTNAIEHRGCHRCARLALFGALRNVLLPSGFDIRVEGDVPAGMRNPAQMQFQHLSKVHSRRHTQRVQHDVDRSTIREERHILFRQNAGDNALVAMSAGELVALGDLTMLRNVDADHLVHAVRQLVAVFFGVFAGDLLDVNHRTGLAVRHTQRGVTHFAALLTEDGAQQALFRSQLGFTLRGDLTHQNVAGFDFGADADNATLIEVGHRVFADVRQITGDLLGTQLGFAGVDLVFLDVNGA